MLAFFGPAARCINLPHCIYSEWSSCCCWALMSFRIHSPIMELPPMIGVCLNDTFSFCCFVSALRFKALCRRILSLLLCVICKFRELYFTTTEKN